MFGNELMLYVRENHSMVMAVAVGIIFLFMLLLLFQVTRTRREVHRVCKKVRKYFDVILAETEEDVAKDMDEKADVQPDKEMVKSEQQTKENLQKQKEVKLLMDVISDVF